MVTPTQERVRRAWDVLDTVLAQLAAALVADPVGGPGRRKLREYGIAPPGPAMPDDGVPIRIFRRESAIACPHCGSLHTEKLSAFGSTACKALHRCLSCREPFEHFKPI